MRMSVPTDMWLEVIPKQTSSKVESLQNQCLMSLKHNKFKLLIEHYKNNTVTTDDTFLLNLFRNIISQIEYHNKEYLFSENIKKCIDYGFNVLEFNAIFAKSLYEKKFNKNTINVLKHNTTYNLYKYKIKEVLPILRTLKTHFNIWFSVE